MSGTFARLVPELIYTQQAEAVLHQCPHWKSHHFRRAMLVKGTALIRRYRAARRNWDPNNKTTLQWILVYFQGYVAMIDAAGRQLRVYAIFTEPYANLTQTVRNLFALLRTSASSHAARVLELTVMSQVKNTVVFDLYSLVGSRSRVRRLPIFGDLESIAFLFNGELLVPDAKTPSAGMGSATTNDL